MQFGLIANFRRPGAVEAINKIADWCREREFDVVLGHDSPDVDVDIPVIPRQDIGKESDFIISLGGDGTILATARALGENSIPILGINLGTLGFLTQFTPEQLEDALERVVNNNFRLSERLALKAEVIDGERLEFPYALNDIVIDKGDVSRVINLSLYAGNEYISSYTADGIIIATPTGSTAYSLAVGGPILNPTMQAFIASPISPFSLTSRPLIFPPELALEIRVRSEHGNALLTIDGQVATKFSPRGTIRITRARHRVKFIQFAENSFYEVLRRKLHWGRLPVVDFTKVDLLKEDPFQD